MVKSIGNGNSDSSTGNGSSSPRDDGKGAGVEDRLRDARAIVVRGEGGKVGEKELRRVGFEVGEWVRGLAEGRGGS